VRLKARLEALEGLIARRRGGVVAIVHYDEAAGPPAQEWVEAQVKEILKRHPRAYRVRLRWPPTGAPEDWRAEE